jgi:hypothetical protein
MNPIILSLPPIQGAESLQLHEIILLSSQRLAPIRPYVPELVRNFGYRKLHDIIRAGAS